MMDEYPEEIVFSINDLVALYEEMSTKDERIKEYIKKIKQIIEEQSC